MDLGAAVAAARQGDEDGFRLLCWHFQPRLLRFLKVYAGQDVEDLASETWLQVVRDLRQFRGDETTFAAWLFTIARRRAIDARRALRRLRLVPVHVARGRSGVSLTGGRSPRSGQRPGVLPLARVTGPCRPPGGSAL